MRRIVLVLAVAAAMVAILVFAAPVFADPDFSDCGGTKGCDALPASPEGPPNPDPKADPPDTGIHADLAPEDKNADEAKDIFTNKDSPGTNPLVDATPGGSSRFPAGNPEHAALQGENCWGDAASGNALFVSHNGFPPGERALDNEGRTIPEKLTAGVGKDCENGPPFNSQ